MGSMPQGFTTLILYRLSVPSAWGGGHHSCTAVAEFAAMAMSLARCSSRQRQCGRRPRLRAMDSGIGLRDGSVADRAGRGLGRRICVRVVDQVYARVTERHFDLRGSDDLVGGLTGLARADRRTRHFPA